MNYGQVHRFFASESEHPSSAQSVRPSFRLRPAASAPPPWIRSEPTIPPGRIRCGLVTIAIWAVYCLATTWIINRMITTVWIDLRPHQQEHVAACIFWKKLGWDIFRPKCCWESAAPGKHSTWQVSKHPPTVCTKVPFSIASLFLNCNFCIKNSYKSHLLADKRLLSPNYRLGLRFFFIRLWYLQFGGKALLKTSVGVIYLGCLWPTHFHYLNVHSLILRSMVVQSKDWTTWGVFALGKHCVESQIGKRKW